MKSLTMGTKINVIRGGERTLGTVSGQTPNGRLIVKCEDGSRLYPTIDEVRLATRPSQSAPSDPGEAVLRDDVRRVFSEYQSTVNRPPTLHELWGWLPLDRAAELAEEMGLHVARAGALTTRGSNRR